VAARIGDSIVDLFGGESVGDGAANRGGEDIEVEHCLGQ
jgi:hypothetical protein